MLIVDYVVLQVSSPSFDILHHSHHLVKDHGITINDQNGRQERRQRRSTSVPRKLLLRHYALRMGRYSISTREKDTFTITMEGSVILNMASANREVIKRMLCFLGSSLNEEHGGKAEMSLAHCIPKTSTDRTATPVVQKHNENLLLFVCCGRR